MHIPRSWARAQGECQALDKRTLKFSVWGWGADDAGARREAAGRLQRLLNRVRGGEEPPRSYQYGRLPLREEILETLEDESPDRLLAVVTRNRYGAQVLNTSGMLFLDIDVPAEGFMQRLRRRFSGDRAGAAGEALARLREALRRHGRSTFRLYQTAAGLRAIAIDREFDPAGRDAQQLMKDTGTDPAFMQLCVVQRSFRARLTPKPWRCASPLPPGEHPRSEPRMIERYAKWLRDYEALGARYATCRYVETVGNGKVSARYDKLVALHDQVTRCGEALPLA